MKTTYIDDVYSSTGSNLITQRTTYQPIFYYYYRHARYLAYRSFVLWCWGYLGKDNRVVISFCVVLPIQQEYPDEDGEYTGFKPLI